jgi:DNA-binding protein YbaB
MSGGYQIISLALADSLFIHDKKNIQEILLRTINESFRTMTIKVKNILVDFQFIDLLNSIPKELLTELGEFRKGYVKKINQFEIAPNIFVSENNKITFTVSGGLKFLSIELSSDYFDIKEKKNIEMELLHSINNIFFSIREEYYHLTQEANDRIKKNPDEIK